MKTRRVISARAFLFALLAASLLAVGNLLARDLRYPPAQADKESLAAMGWEAARDSLGPDLAAAYVPGHAGKPGSAGSPACREWLVLWKWADLLSRNEADEAANFLGRHLFAQPGSDTPVFYPPGHAPEDGLPSLPREELRARVLHEESRGKSLGRLLGTGVPMPVDAPISARLDPAIVRGWFLDPAFSAMVFDTLGTADYAPGVLAILQEIQTAHPAAFREFPALALAIAVVYEARGPDFWPHHQVKEGLVPVVEESPAAIFARWAAAAAGPGLLNDLRTLPPGDLKFVIDAPLAESEFVWARKNVRLPESGFGRAFSSVKYVMPRVKARKFTWEEGPYTLEAISKNGGICVDQAYFAMVAGKARGLPTLFFTGQGADGGHAWFGFRKGIGRWDLDCGRYENQNYATGEALDPQSWRPITDHDLKSLAEGFRQSPEFAASTDDIVLAAAFERAGDLPSAAKAYASAVAVCPRNPSAWDACGDFLARTGAPADERRAFHEAAAKQFLARRDARVRHQTALAAIARESGDQATADKITARIISQNKRARSDLSVNAAAAALLAKAESGDPAAAMTEYRSMIRKIGKEGGGNFFYEIVTPLFETLVSLGDTRNAAAVLDLARKSLRPTKGQILDQELTDLEKSLQ